MKANGWVGKFCDAKKLKSTNFLKREIIPRVMNFNRNNFSAETKNKQTTCVFIKTVSKTSGSSKS